MAGLSSIEQAAVARCAEGDWMVSQVLNWAEVNSGSRNLDGLAAMAELLAGAYGALPGRAPASVPSGRAEGS
jgi:glutamate carboxypeptidase